MRDTVHLPAVLADQFAISCSEARRSLSQGGVRVNGEVVHDLDWRLAKGDELRLGGRRTGTYMGLPVVTHPSVRRDWLSLVQGGRVVTVMHFGKRTCRCPTCYLPMRYWFAPDWFLCDLCGTCVTSERLEDRPRWRRWLDWLMGMEF